MSDKDSLFSNAVWDRADHFGAETMSRKLYMLATCGFTALGIALSAATSMISYGWDMRQWSVWAMLGFMLGVLAIALVGTYIATENDSPLISMMGYALVAGPFGLMLGPVVGSYTTASVLKILALTTGVVLTLGLIGATIPDDLSSWGTPLLGGLLFLIGGYFIVPLMGMFGLPVDGAMTALDWIGVVIFGGLVIFDLNRAVRLPHTLDNAIDSAMAIYLDFINIFLRLLSLMGQKK